MSSLPCSLRLYLILVKPVYPTRPDSLTLLQYTPYQGLGLRVPGHTRPSAVRHVTRCPGESTTKCVAGRVGEDVLVSSEFRLLPRARGTEITFRLLRGNEDRLREKHGYYSGRPCHHGGMQHVVRSNGDVPGGRWG